MKDKISYRFVNELNGESVFGFKRDDRGFWFTDFSSVKWQKIRKGEFLNEVEKCKKTNGLKLIENDPTLVMFV